MRKRKHSLTSNLSSLLFIHKDKTTASLHGWKQSPCRHYQTLTGATHRFFFFFWAYRAPLFWFLCQALLNYTWNPRERTRFVKRKDQRKNNRPGCATLWYCNTGGSLQCVTHTHSTTTCTFFVATLLIYSIACSPALVPSSFFFFFASASTDKYIIIQRSARIWSGVINSWCPAVFLSIPDIVSVFLSLFLWRRWHGSGFKNIPASQMDAGVVLQLQYDSMWHVSLCDCLRRFEVLALHSLSRIVHIFLSQNR